MKKISAIVLMISVMLAISAKAASSVGFTMLDSNGVFLDSGMTTPVGAGALVCLVWSADSSYETPVFGSIPSVKGSAFGADYLLYSGNAPIDGGFASDLDGMATYTSADVNGATIQNGYVYMMLFASAAPVVGTQYVLSTMVNPLTDLTPVVEPPQPPTPDQIDISPSGAYMGQPGLSGTVVAVPEPSTVGLLLVGAGLVALRRVRKV